MYYAYQHWWKSDEEGSDDETQDGKKESLPSKIDAASAGDNEDNAFAHLPRV